MNKRGIGSFFHSAVTVELIDKLGGGGGGALCDSFVSVGVRSNKPLHKVRSAINFEAPRIRTYLVMNNRRETKSITRAPIMDKTDAVNACRPGGLQW